MAWLVYFPGCLGKVEKQDNFVRRVLLVFDCLVSGSGSYVDWGCDNLNLYGLFVKCVEAPRGLE